VMPQTREHAAILDLLGLDRGVVALTKADRADPDRIAAVTGEIHALLAGTGLVAAPVVACSALMGSGIDDLACGFRWKPATHSDAKPASVPI
jgi:selenocysteine-specific elongation factor